MSFHSSGNLAYQYRESYAYNQVTGEEKKKKTMPVKEKLFYIFAVLFVVLLASIVISGYAQIAESNYEIQKLEKSISTINQNNEDLQRKIAELSSPDRILKLAQEKLGMTLNEDQIVVLYNK